MASIFTLRSRRGTYGTEVQRCCTYPGENDDNDNDDNHDTDDNDDNDDNDDIDDNDKV